MRSPGYIKVLRVIRCAPGYGPHACRSDPGGPSVSAGWSDAEEELEMEDSKLLEERKAEWEGLVY